MYVAAERKSRDCGRDKSKGDLYMWKKIKDSKFAAKVSELLKNRGAVTSLVCLTVALMIVASVSIATNVTKKKYAGKDSIGGEKLTQQTDDAQHKPPIYNDGGSNEASGKEDEEFSLSLPVSSGTVGKNHDASIQVWSDTLGDYRVHLGIDIVTGEDAPVLAAANGEVARIWDDALLGKCVAVSHDGNVFTIYKNLSAELPENIKVGVKVERGQKIGSVGESAISELADEPHLHFEMTVDGVNVNPMDYFSKDAKNKLGMDQSFEDSGK